MESRSASKGIRQDNLKLRLAKPEGEISRRELLTLMWPHYEVIPFIEPTGCRGYRECGLCVDICPLEAIKVDQDKVIIDRSLCSGCGACLTTCLHKAIVYPTFSLEELDREMEGWLLPKDIVLAPRIIAATCQSCSPAFDQDVVEQLCNTSSILPLKIPCLAMVSPWLMLRAFDMGAQGFALISGKCRSGFDSSRWQENVRFIQGLFNCWDIEAERIRVFNIAEGDSGRFEQKLGEFTTEIKRLDPTSLGMSEPISLPAEGLWLPALIKGVGNKLRSSSKGAVSAGAVPFGKVELDSPQCTGCSLCALDCPTGALVVSSSEETGTYQLLFKHDVCVACGRCVEACPEKCLRLEPVLELDRMDKPVVVFEDRVVRCCQCDSPIGPRAMIDKLQAKVLAAGQSFSTQFELCPMCKTKLQLSPTRADAQVNLLKV